MYRFPSLYAREKGTSHIMNHDRKKSQKDYKIEHLLVCDPQNKTKHNLAIRILISFHRFWQAKFPHGGSVLGSSQFSILLQLPPKILLDSKVVKIDPKIIISLSDTLCSIKTLLSAIQRRIATHLLRNIEL